MEQNHRTAKQLHATVRKYVKKWKGNLYLGLWKININVENHIEPSNCGTQPVDNGWCLLATTRTDWRYLTASIKFSYDGLFDADDKQIERTVVHELLHVLLNEMREEGTDHEERVVSHLEIAFESTANILV
jgi:hypothetical protein